MFDCCWSLCFSLHRQPQNLVNVFQASRSVHTILLHILFGVAQLWHILLCMNKLFSSPRPQIFQKDFLSTRLLVQTKKARANVTHKYAHSVMNCLLVNIPLECVMKAIILIILGITRTLVDWTFLFYNQLEQTEMGTDFRTCQLIEKALESTTHLPCLVREASRGHHCCCRGASQGITDEFKKNGGSRRDTSHAWPISKGQNIMEKHSNNSRTTKAAVGGEQFMKLNFGVNSSICSS